NSFRKALEAGGRGTAGWYGVMYEAARDLKAQTRRLAVLDLARQCVSFDNKPLAEELTSLALDGVTDDGERLALTLFSVAGALDAGRPDRADELLKPILADERLAQDAGLWRLGLHVAVQRRQTNRAFECLERALDLECEQPALVVNLQTVREEYGS